ncbi:hypothetical protein [Roseibium aggregatum]|uniref:Uncharacterized protein n=1 Tax=Roseibium aggregatum TaxID=187304 RepID=A0A0M6Y9R6_9HYPH|nr:hypothetical protein [Roseibium aggregatum]CTQ45751.1 hypothetical protein LAL4801_04206 [Roseibium aggregatum]
MSNTVITTGHLEDYAKRVGELDRAGFEGESDQVFEKLLVTGWIPPVPARNAAETITAFNSLYFLSTGKRIPDLRIPVAKGLSSRRQDLVYRELIPELISAIEENASTGTPITRILNNRGLKTPTRSVHSQQWMPGKLQYHLKQALCYDDDGELEECLENYNVLAQVEARASVSKRDIREAIKETVVEIFEEVSLEGGGWQDALERVRESGVKKVNGEEWCSRSLLGFVNWLKGEGVKLPKLYSKAKGETKGDQNIRKNHKNVISAMERAGIRKADILADLRSRQVPYLGGRGRGKGVKLWSESYWGQWERGCKKLGLKIPDFK